MMDAFHANLLLLQSRGLSTPPRPFDCAIRLLVSGGSNGGFESANAELLFAHSHILALKSQSLRAQLEQSPSVPVLQLLQQCPEALGLAGTGALGTELRQINLDISTLDNGLEPFKQLLAFLYGETPNSDASPEHLLFLSKLLAVPELELFVRSLLLGRLLSGQAAQPTEMAPADFACSSNSIQSAGGQQQMNGSQLPFYAACMQLQSIFGKSLPEVASNLVAADAPSQSSPSFAASLLVQQPRPASDSPERQSVIGMAERRESASSGSSLPSSVAGPASELLVPSNDKEGWCRNKKYIQIVKKGYRCLLCNKVYGRYNSVSYHVTIYHRNPPIRCEEQGCQFTTREARYIHFHKYYRHQIALPESIDLASRKCPLLGCKHVSKSPAMLDKHVQRHVADCLKEGVYFCQMCSSSVTDGGCPQFTANTHELMYQHLLGQHSTRRNPDEQKAEEDGVDDNNKHQQDQQHAIGNGIARLASASAPNTPPNMRFQCDGCNFKARTLMTLEQHKTQKHGGGGSQLQSLPQLGSMPASFSALFGGLFPAAGFASSLPGSPLSPTNSTLAGGGLFPPPSSLPLLDHQQQSNAQQLLAQLLTAQKFASALLSSSSSQQNSPPNGVDKLF